jgi:hypothetical protein
MTNASARDLKYNYSHYLPDGQFQTWLSDVPMPGRKLWLNPDVQPNDVTDRIAVGIVYQGDFSNSFSSNNNWLERQKLIKERELLRERARWHRGNTAAKLSDPVNAGQVTGGSLDGRYFGEWSENKFHGLGALWLTNGRKYYGSFVGGRIEGSGLISNADGTTRYIGQFMAGYFEGIGQFLGASLEYTGQFKLDRFHGSGELNSLDGSVAYRGLFQEGIINGIGILSVTDAKGNLQHSAGTFDNALLSGEGISFASDGSFKFGSFSQGALVGEAVSRHSNGSLSVGQWFEGSPTGDHLLLSADGKLSILSTSSDAARVLPEAEANEKLPIIAQQMARFSIAAQEFSLSANRSFANPYLAESLDLARDQIEAASISATMNVAASVKSIEFDPTRILAAALLTNSADIALFLYGGGVLDGSLLNDTAEKMVDNLSSLDRAAGDVTFMTLNTISDPVRAFRRMERQILQFDRSLFVREMAQFFEESWVDFRDGSSFDQGLLVRELLSTVISEVAIDLGVVGTIGKAHHALVATDTAHSLNVLSKFQPQLSQVQLAEAVTIAERIFPWKARHSTTLGLMSNGRILNTFEVYKDIDRIRHKLAPGVSPNDLLAEMVETIHELELFSAEGLLNSTYLNRDGVIIPNIKELFVGTELTEAVRNWLISDGSDLKDWRKVTTRQPIISGPLKFQIHYYYNVKTLRVREMKISGVSLSK